MNDLRKKLQNNQTLFGSMTFLGSKEIAGILGALDYDFVFICAEHTAYGIEKTCDLVKACEQAGTPTMVRLPEWDKPFTKKILDHGASAVLFPMIRSAKQAKEAMDLCLYPPYGERGFGPMYATRWGLDSEKEYVEQNLEGTVRMIQLEHIDAIRELEEIVQNPYIDGYVFGPNDLAASMGHIGDMYHEDVQAVIKDAVEILKRHNKRFGLALVSTDKETIEYWKNMGMNIFALGADWKMILDGARSIYEDLKDVIK